MNTEKKPSGDSTSSNPYLNARRVWNAHEGDILSSRQTWQIIGILSLLIALSSVGGIVYIGQQSRFIPYVVQVDRLGQAAASGFADRASPVDTRVMQATLAAFIADARLVTPDVALQRSAVFRVYAFLDRNAPGTTKMNEWLNTNGETPFTRAAREVVHTEIISVLQQSPESWQIDWTEQIRDRDGTLKSTSRMRALLSVSIVPPSPATDEEQIRRNPLGIYVTDFSWSKQL